MENKVDLHYSQYADLHDLANDIIIECILLQDELARSCVVKAAARRARVKTLKLEKQFKLFRQLSLEYHR